MTGTVKPGLYVVEVKATFTDVHGMLWAILAGDGMVAASELRAVNAPEEPTP